MVLLELCKLRLREAYSELSRTRGRRSSYVSWGKMSPLGRVGIDPPGAPYIGSPGDKGSPTNTIQCTVSERTTGVLSSPLDVTRHGYSACTLVTSMAL